MRAYEFLKEASIFEGEKDVPSDIARLIKKDPSGSKGLVFKYIRKKWGWEYQEAENATKKYYEKYHGIGPDGLPLDEGEVVDTKFAQKLGQKRGMVYNPDVEIPVSLRDGKPFDRFETRDIGTKSAEIIGIRDDGYTEVVSTTTRDTAPVLAGAFNAGGYSPHKIEKIPITW